MAKYNGFPSKSIWNQSLWLNNTERLYYMAVFYKREAKKAGADHPSTAAARAMLASLKSRGVTHTDDGYRWTFTGLRHVMRGLA